MQVKGSGKEKDRQEKNEKVKAAEIASMAGRSSGLFFIFYKEKRCGDVNAAPNKKLE